MKDLNSVINALLAGKTLLHVNGKDTLKLKNNTLPPCGVLHAENWKLDTPRISWWECIPEGGVLARNKTSNTIVLIPDGKEDRFWDILEPLTGNEISKLLGNNIKCIEESD